MKTLYFTATGNSLSVAKKIGGELISLPQAIKNNQYEFEDDAVGLVFPIYCCYIPKIVRDFISKAKFKADYLFAVATYGNGMGKGGDGSAIAELDKILKLKGYNFNYLNSILMVDNFIDIFDINQEVKLISSKHIDENSAAIAEDIKMRKNYIKQTDMFGKMITVFCKGMSKNLDMGLSAQEFILDDKCTGCGICSQVCPCDNIVVSDKAAFGKNCSSCYSCIHNCPQKAIHKKKEKNDVRWRNPDVSLNEIIEANCQR